MAEDVADIILTDPGALPSSWAARCVPVTVLFADIRGFTRYTEQHTATAGRRHAQPGLPRAEPCGLQLTAAPSTSTWATG